MPASCLPSRRAARANDQHDSNPAAASSDPSGISGSSGQAILAAVFGLMLARSLTEGVGFVLLIPLLGLGQHCAAWVVAVGDLPQGLSGIARAFWRASHDRSIADPSSSWPCCCAPTQLCQFGCLQYLSCQYHQPRASTGLHRLVARQLAASGRQPASRGYLCADRAGRKCRTRQRCSCSIWRPAD